MKKLLLSACLVFGLSAITYAQDTESHEGHDHEKEHHEGDGHDHENDGEHHDGDGHDHSKDGEHHDGDGHDHSAPESFVYSLSNTATAKGYVAVKEEEFVA